MTRSTVPVAYREAPRRAPRGVTGGVQVAQLDSDETVVFLIGMRINRLRKVRSWWPVFVGMPQMVRELEQHPDAGLLGARSFWSGRMFLTVQYWRSAEDLGRYARDPGLRHHPAWKAFNRAAAGSGDVGVFHETYTVGRDDVETLYGNMPPVGLALAHTWVPRGTRPPRSVTQDRMGQQDPEYVEAS